MKKLLAALFLSAAALCTAQDHSLREVYDLYKPLSYQCIRRPAARQSFHVSDSAYSGNPGG